MILLLSLNPIAEDEPALAQSLLTRKTLTGDWGGLRTRLANKGFAVEAVYTGEVFSNTVGGRHRASVYLDNVDLLMTFDMQKLLGWPGATLFLYGLGNQGDDPSENIGDAQTVSNIAAFSTWKLYEAWVQQNLLKYQMSFLVGLYDLNSEFDALQSANLFINSSHGIDPTFSQAGVNGPSIFPFTTIGMRLKLAPIRWLYVQSVVLNGIAGNPANPRGTQIVFGKNDGILSTTEIGYLIRPVIQTEGSGRHRHRHIGRLATPEYEGKIAVGFWFYTAQFDALLQPQNAPRPQKLDDNHGVYLTAEQTVFHEKDHADQGLTLFARVGFANSKINRFGSYTGAGAVYTGLIPGRDHDQIGFAVAGAHNGSQYKKALLASGETVENSEWNFEWTYEAPLTPWLTVQPDIQYVINPDTNPAVKNALAVDIRLEISF